MQLENFEKFVLSHLDLVPCLSELRYFDHGYTLEDIVRLQLEYVAVRPWETLKVNEVTNFEHTDYGEVNVTYTVYAHIEGDGTPCSKVRSSSLIDGTSIQQVIEELVEWHKLYWAKQDNRPLVFDAVTRTSRKVKYKKESWFDDKIAMSFYLFPEGFTA